MIGPPVVCNTIHTPYFICAEKKNDMMLAFVSDYFMGRYIVQANNLLIGPFCYTHPDGHVVLVVPGKHAKFSCQTGKLDKWSPK